MYKIASVALTAALGVAGVAQSQPAEAHPYVVVEPYAFAPAYYAPYYWHGQYWHGRYWHHGYDRYRYEHFHRWDRR
jgi:hypothetical protein